MTASPTTPRRSMADELDPRPPCPVRSSVTDAPCLLPAGHEPDSPNRFHRYRATPVIIAAAQGWPGDWHGILQEVVSKEPLRTIVHDRCPHRHRRMDKARECASDRAPAFWAQWKAASA